MRAYAGQADPPPTRRTVNLPLALAISVLLHLVLALLMPLLGAFDEQSELARAQQMRQREVDFSFAPTAAEEDQGQIEEAPATEIPGEVIDPPASEPVPPLAADLDPAPTPTAALAGLPLPPTPAQEEVVPQQQELAAQEQTLSPEAEPEREEADVGVEELTRRESLPPAPRGLFSKHPAARQTPTLNERLSAFDQKMQRRLDALPRTNGPVRNVFEPDWSSLPATGQSVGQLVFESVDYDFSDYGRQIYWILWKTWHNRIYDRVDDFERWSRQDGQWVLQHANGVSFSIAGDGDIYDIVLEFPSGCRPLDLTATEALDEALFPPLPPDFPRAQERVRVTFHAQGSVNTMRRHLAYLKSHGVF